MGHLGPPETAFPKLKLRATVMQPIDSVDSGPESQSILEPIESSGHSLDSPCPHCLTDLVRANLFDRWEVGYCEDCLGFLIRSASFQIATHELRARYRGLDDAPQKIDTLQLERRSQCPACLGDFDTHPYYGAGNVVISNCHCCELTWLNSGDLMTIIRAPGKRPDQYSSPLIKPYSPVAPIKSLTMMGFFAKAVRNIFS